VRDPDLQNDTIRKYLKFALVEEC